MARLKVIRRDPVVNKVIFLTPIFFPRWKSTCRQGFPTPEIVSQKLIADLLNIVINLFLEIVFWLMET